MAPNQYIVVDFWDKNAASNIVYSEVVPFIWYQNETLRWPPKNLNSRKAIKDYFAPEETWPVYDSILRYTFDSYEQALLHGKKSCVTSDVNSEAECGKSHRVKKPRVVFSPSKPKKTQPTQQEKRKTCSEQENESEHSDSDDGPASTHSVDLPTPPITGIHQQTLTSSSMQSREQRNQATKEFERPITEVAMVQNSCYQEESRSHLSETSQPRQYTTLTNRSYETPLAYRGSLEENSSQHNYYNFYDYSSNQNPVMQQPLMSPGNMSNFSHHFQEEFHHSPRRMPSPLQFQRNAARFGVPSNGRQHLRQNNQNDLVHTRPCLPNEPQRQRPASGSGIQDPVMSTGAISSSSVGQATTQKTSVNVLPKSPSKNRSKQNFNAHFARTLEKVLENQEEVKKELRALKESRRNESSEDEYDGLTNDELPCTTMEEFNQFELGLEIRENRNKLVALIRSIGGTKLPCYVYEAWGKVITDNVAKNLNWTGVLRKNSNKTGIGKMKITRAILDGIRQSKNLKDVTEDEFKIQTNSFLRHTPARFIAKSGKN